MVTGPFCGNLRAKLAAKQASVLILLVNQMSADICILLVDLQFPGSEVMAVGLLWDGVLLSLDLCILQSCQGLFQRVFSPW